LNFQTLNAAHHDAKASQLRAARVLAIQLLPAIAIVLIGWGVDDLPAFFLNLARLGLSAVTMMAAITAVCLRLDLQPLRRGAAPIITESLQLGVLLLLSAALLWFLPFADRHRILTLHHDSWRFLGLAVCALGVAVRLSALRALGEFFSAYVTLQPNHRLVRDGIYKYIRHPLYLSLLLIPTGIALIFASGLAVPILILAVIFVFDRIKKEDHLLSQHFGLEFDDYRRNTQKLVPFVI
jgi:protein-S-isoprenylcysteine O-methyltransferase Ste14